ncbi:ABC transporter C family member 8 [Acorus gramineus]|uniref:ABC transporter C family member 8 n=1 Tax=Acorus gramineus TaxID=55184 RepID=A0AAV9AL22_ACOGR|nr:ABC transporter C family member 8 [Acorus gramineus]
MTSDFGSSCTQREVIDVVNLTFLVIFCLALLIGSLRKQYINVSRTKDWFTISVSICCSITFIANLSIGLWDLVYKNNGLAYIVRGLVWLGISVSLNIKWTKWIQVLALTWWFTFSTLISLLNLKTLVETHNLPIPDAISWPMNLLLLFFAFRVTKHLICRSNLNKSTLSQPLLSEEHEKQTNLPNVGVLSRLTFSWMNHLLSLGYRKPLDLDDIPTLDSKDGAFLACENFAQHWIAQRKKNSNSNNLVLLALMKCYHKEMVVVGVYALLKTIAVSASPILLYAFVKYSTREERSTYEGLLLLGCFVVMKLVESLSQRHMFFDSKRFGMRMRSALMGAIFQKQLKLSSFVKRNHSTGEIVNYIAVDVYRMGDFPWWFHMSWTLPLQLIFAIAILFATVRIGALPSLIPLVACGLLNLPFAKILQKCQSRYMDSQNVRLRATSEALNNMKIIKLQSWEEKFKNSIKALRDSEFEWLTETQIKKSYGTALYWMSPTFVSAVVFAGCAVLGGVPLNASTVFTILATMRVMSEPVRMIPEAISMMIQVKVSLDRVEKFLLEDEIKEGDIVRSPKESSIFSVRIREGNFSWDTTEQTNITLKNIDLEIQRGQKIAVCGAVGAGKTSLLHAMLGEIQKISGSVEIYGSIAYVSQTSWIQSGTIRDDILYGKPMEKVRYERAIKACALDKDIENFSHGDLTEIGQRGLNMSGGQKQRIQLARALYNDADIYLLDDPFSAVDAHTAASLFKDYVMDALQNKTVILVTHQVEFLTETDQILVIEGGRITQMGSYEELLKLGTVFEQLVSAHQSAMSMLEPASHDQQSETQKKLAYQPENSEGEISMVVPSTVQLTEDEEKAIGDVGWKPYIDYIRVSNGYMLFALCTLFQTAFVILQSMSTYWLAIGVQIPSIGKGVLIGVYTAFSVFGGLSAYLRSWFAALLGLKASKAFFFGFMDSVFRAPMLFFDSTPVGRILTRASSDMSVLDYDLPFSIAFTLAASIEIVASIVVMAAVTWQVLIVAAPILLVVKYVQAYYLASARELTRINGTTKAPVMNYATETSLGVVTIRAFSMVDRFIQNNLRLIDTDATLFFHTSASIAWVLLRVEALQNFTIFTSTLLLILLPRGTIAPGLVGLSLSYALTLSSTQVFMTQWYCNLDNHIISVERVKQFSHIPPEPPAVLDNNRPPSSWPSEGRIDFQDLKMRYRPNAPLVLKGITCTFVARNKVGVVGRTGSGKTTMISALFRLMEPSGGRILIDDLDIGSIGLKDLRMKLSIIPQEPTLFRGSVRTNLDPLGLHSDHEIWQALEKCQLKATISGLPKLLDSSVSDEGENWSAGQRQLFCLGRVLLRRNRILVLDEATASIDSATDTILQSIIRHEFSSCTVITIAHRVPTVMDSDMVMVLSYGKMLEYERPLKLMETNSAFSKLVNEYWSSCRRPSLQNLNNYH